MFCWILWQTNCFQMNSLQNSGSFLCGNFFNNILLKQCCMQIESLRKPSHNKLYGKIYWVAREAETC